MDQIEKEFEEMLINTCNTELINKYCSLKEEIVKLLMKQVDEKN